MQKRRIAAWLGIAFVVALGCSDAAWARRQAAPAPRAANPRWPRPEVLSAAKRAFACGQAAGEFSQPILTIIDYSLPSTQKRLWVIDLAKQRILFHELVAHGRNSGEQRATTFSDRNGSKMSSLGLFRTGETYLGKHGLSLRLDGLEPGFNENARRRAIVLHGAPYVSTGAIAKKNQLGRSWGCPAVSPIANRRIIDRIDGGTALFAYYPDRHWLRSSDFLHCGHTAGTQVAGRWSGWHTGAIKPSYTARD